jgi:hypothetical protein
VDIVFAQSKRSTKSTKREKGYAGTRDEGSLSKVVLTGAAVCPPPRVKCAARSASQVHRAGEEVRDGIATAQNRDSYADI